MAYTLQGAKSRLRAELKKRLKNIPWEVKCQQSESVLNKLLQNKKFQESCRISIYLSRDIEISTNAILNEIFKSGKKCFIPKYQASKPIMDMVKLDSMEDYESLPVTAWSIKQPSDDDNERENAMSTGGFDLMIVPGIGFTTEGHRIGNGKGYYDIFIKTYMKHFNKSIYTIGLAFREQIVPKIPVDEQDVVINEIIVPD